MQSNTTGPAFFMPYLVGTGLLMAALGCDTMDEAAVTIQPLSIGSTWTFVDSVFSENVAVSPLTISIPGTASVPDRRGGVYQWEVKADGQVRETNLIGLEDGHVIHYAAIVQGDTLLARKTWAIYPVAVGDTFQEPRFSYDAGQQDFVETGTWTWTCISTTDQLQVGGRTLSLVVFEARPDASTAHRLAYALDVGYAGWTTRVDGAVVFKETLVSYTLR